MKRIICVLLALTLAALTVLSCAAADTVLVEEGKTVTTYGDWIIEKIENDTRWNLDSYIGEGGDVVVPRFISDLLVVSLGHHAFANNTTVTSVITSSPLWDIGDYAFIDCTSLKSFVCHYALKTIGVGAFSGTKSLTDINLETTALTTISDYAFADSGLTQVRLPDTCESIGVCAFVRCRDLDMIVIPASVTEIADNAFDSCDKLTIYCYENSCAHQYAVENEIPFVLMDGFSDSVSFTSHSISLNGDIVVNFYVDVPDEYVDAGKAKVNFTWTVDGKENTRSVTLSPDVKYSYGYKAACPVAVAEMTYGITASVMIDGVLQCIPDRYSVQKYAKLILTDYNFATKYINSENSNGRNGEERLDQLRTLVRTMLDYGSKAQIRFNRKTDDLANSGTDYFTGEVTIPSKSSDMDAYLNDCGLEYYGSSVIYLSKTTLRHYYKIVDSSKFTTEIKNGVTFDGQPVTYGTKSGLIYFDKADIAAPKLDTEYVLRLNGHDYQYSALDYSALSYSSDASAYADSIAKQLAASVYRYNQAANAFFNE